MKAPYPLLALVLLATVITACSGSGGTNTQSYSPSPTGSSTTNSSARSTSSSSPTDPKSSTSSKPSTMPVSTPTVPPAGQGAVNAYIGMTNVVNSWALNPAKSLSSQLQPYVSTAVLKDIESEYQQLAANHVAYRGTPDTPHLKVISATGGATVLSDCSIASPTDPFSQYDVKTGKAVKSSAGGPYLKAITVLKNGSTWKVNSVVPNTARVCHA